MRSFLLIFLGFSYVPGGFSQTCIEMHSSNGKKKYRFSEGVLVSVKPINSDTILEKWRLELAKPIDFTISAPIVLYDHNGSYNWSSTKRETLQLHYQEIQWIDFYLPNDKIFMNNLFFMLGGMMVLSGPLIAWNTQNNNFNAPLAIGLVSIGGAFMSTGFLRKAAQKKYRKYYIEGGQWIVKGRMY